MNLTGRLDRPDRAQRIWPRGLRLAWLLTAHACRTGVRLALNRLGTGRAPPGQIVGSELAAFCESAGAVWCKFGQALSMRPDLLSPEAAEALARLRDSLPPIDHASAVAIVASDLPRHASQIELEHVVLGSATIATVYRARLPNGRPAAMKIRRPGVVGQVLVDAAILRATADRMAHIRPFRDLPVREVVDQVADCVERQVDFEREARNAARLRASLTRVAGVQVPRVFPEFSRGRVLTMELMPGATPRPGSEDAAVAALRALYRMIFIDGFVHCDLHSGNLRVGASGDALVLDAGLVAELSDIERLRFARFFHGLVMGAGPDCAKVMRESALGVAADFDRAGFDRAVAAIVANASGQGAATFDVAHFAAAMFDVQRRFGLRSSPGFTMPIVALLVFEGIAKSVVPDLDFQREARPFLASVLLPAMMRERTVPFS